MEDKTYTQVRKDIDQFLSLADIYPFTNSQLDNQFNFKTRDAKRYRWQVLEGYVKEGSLSKIATGKYKKISLVSEEINWQDADIEDIIDVRWPMELEKYIKTYHQSIAVIAGDPGSGKTAFLENFTLRNMDNKMGVVLFSNDMTEEEIKERMLNAGVYIPNPAPFKIWDCFSDFQDHQEFRPDGINVIDYLDLNSEVYMIGNEIEKIYRKLNRGMALIAIQKKPGQNIGIGGVFSWKRAKIYLSLGTVKEGAELYHKLAIEKCRGRVDPKVNPRGMVWKFKLIGGIKFWVKEVG